MADNTDLIGATRTDVIPGYTIVRRDIEQTIELEQYLAAMHRRGVLVSAAGLTPAQENKAMQHADATVAAGLFSSRSPFFDEAIKRETTVPFLLWINLKVSRPTLTFDETKTLLSQQTEGKLTDSPKFWDIRKALLEAWGYEFKSSKNVLTPQIGAGNSQTGNPSSDSSAASADLATTKSNDSP
jgi:hypothetical protein